MLINEASLRETNYYYSIIELKVDLVDVLMR